MTWPAKPFLAFADGRRVEIEDTGAMYYMWRDHEADDGKEYTFTRITAGVFSETSVRQLKWWQCDCGRGWWGGDTDPESEARGCFSCRSMVNILDLQLADSKRQRQSWWKNVIDLLVEAARKRVRQ